ncbi:hypothetical protein D5366_08800 [Neokomagataea tanensis]|uniref:Uncharacterized protein n=2 Tax=Neokomagataea TaxID=1223423 RepID=A0A4Y6V9F4_9PROT|nr:hypothetical protein [Neokomagataea tanensis]QDH25290.1 hypothetical protein D5366_08800 [Neokomagataea tanensis]
MAVHGVNAFSSGGRVLIDDITFENKLENHGVLENLLHAKGLHYRKSEENLPVHLDGKNSTLEQATYLDTNKNKIKSNISIEIPDYASFHFYIELLKSEKEPYNTDNQSLKSMRFSLKGDRFLQTLPKLLPTGLASYLSDGRFYLALQELAQSEPAYAPAADYVHAPNNRTLSIDFVPSRPIPLSAVSLISKSPLAGMMFFNQHSISTSVQ